MSLQHVQRTYEELGRTDPLYAVLSHRDKAGGRWDPAAFFATGRREVDEAQRYLSGLGLEPAGAAALDFGCGVGRLTQALCAHFERVVGVDISASMVAHARRLNRCGERCRYAVNAAADLALLPDAAFDLVYSNITLQHSPPECSLRYVAEFFRVLRPGGIALFHLPSGPRHEPGTWSAALYHLRYSVLRRWSKRLRGRPLVEMHYVARSRVEETIAAAGGTLVDVAPFGSRRRHRVGLRYCAVRAGGREATGARPRVRAAARPS